MRAPDRERVTGGRFRLARDLEPRHAYGRSVRRLRRPDARGGRARALARAYEARLRTFGGEARAQKELVGLRGRGARRARVRAALRAPPEARHRESGERERRLLRHGILHRRRRLPLDLYGGRGRSRALDVRDLRAGRGQGAPPDFIPCGTHRVVLHPRRRHRRARRGVHARYRRHIHSGAPHRYRDAHPRHQPARRVPLVQAVPAGHAEVPGAARARRFGAQPLAHAAPRRRGDLLPAVRLHAGDAALQPHDRQLPRRRLHDARLRARHAAGLGAHRLQLVQYKEQREGGHLLQVGRAYRDTLRALQYHQ